MVYVSHASKLSYRACAMRCPFSEVCQRGRDSGALLLDTRMHFGIVRSRHERGVVSDSMDMV